MSSAERSAAPPRRLRLRGKIALGALAAVLGVLVAHPLWLPDALERALPPLARRFADLELRLEVARASARKVEVRHLSLRPAGPEGALESLTLEHARTELELWLLLRGDVLGALGHVRLRGLHISLDLTRPTPPPTEPTREPAPLELPARLPRVEVASGSLRLRIDAQRAFAARSLAFEVREDGQGRLAARGLAFETDGSDLTAERAELRFAYADGRADVHGLLVDGQEWIGPSWIDLAPEGGLELAARLDLRLLGGRAELGLELDADHAAVAFEIADLDLGRAPPALVPEALGPLAGHLEARGEARLPRDEPLAGTAELAVSARRVSIFRQDDLELSAELALSDRRLLAPWVLVQSGANHVRAEELSIPLAEGGVLETLSAARARLSVLVADPRPLLEQLELDLPPEHEPRFVLEAALENAELVVRSGSLESRAMLVRLSAGRMELSDPGRPEIDLDLVLAIPDLELALAPFAPAPPAGELFGVASLRGTWPELAGEARLSGSGLVAAEVPLGELELLLVLTEGARLSAELVTSSPAARVEGRGALTLRGGLGPDLDLRLERTTMEAEIFALAALASVLPEGRGRARLELEGSIEEPRFELTLELEELLQPGLPLTDASLAARGDRGRIELEALEARGPFGSLGAAAALELDASLRPRSVELWRLTLARGDADLTLQAPSLIEVEPGGFEVGRLELAGSVGRLVADGGLDAGGGRFSAHASELDLAPFYEGFEALGFYPGRLDGWVELEAVGRRLTLDGGGRVEGARWAESPPLDLDWEVQQREAATDLHALLAWPDGSLLARASLPLDPLGEDPLAPGDVELSLELGGGLTGLAAILGAAGIEASGAMDAHLAVGGPWESLEGRFLASGELVQLTAGGFALLAEPARLDADLSLGHGAAGDTRGDAGGDAPRDTLRFHAPERFLVEAEGDLGGPLDLRALLREGAASLGERSIEGSLRASVEDVGEPIRALEAQGLERLLLRSGSLAFEASASGTLAEPELEGQVVLADALMRLGGILPPLRGVGGSFLIEQDRILIEGLTGEMGGAPFQVVGQIHRREPPPDAEPGTPRRFELDFTLSGENLLLFRERGILVRSDGTLRVRGFVEEGLEITGALALTDGSYTRNIDLLSFERDRRPTGARGIELFSLREPPLSDMRFDVEVTTHAPFRIDNNALVGSVRPQIRLQGTGEVPVLIGTIFMDPTRVRLPSGPMRFESGTIRFDPANPFVPQLALTGGMRLRGFDIQVIVAGPYDAPEVTLSSSPPLPDRALLMLVLTGELPPDAEGALAGAGAGRALAIFLARDFLTRWFDDESVDDDESLIDRFEIAAGRDVTREGSETVEVSFRLADRVFFPNDALYLRGERDVYDEYNYGVRLLFRFR